MVGKCINCGCDILPASAVGYCYRCVTELHDKMEKKYPFKVYDGNGCELGCFETKSEAEEFLYTMQNSYLK